MQRIGMHMNFFSAGGTSLLAGMVALKLNETFGCEESATLLFNHPTIEDIAAKMESLPAGAIAKQVHSLAPLEERSAVASCTSAIRWHAVSCPLVSFNACLTLPERCCYH